LCKTPQPRRNLVANMSLFNFTASEALESALILEKTDVGGDVGGWVPSRHC
jgi:hypothetical protein